MLPETIEYRPSKLRSVLLFLVCVALVFRGYLMFADPKSSTTDHWMGLFGMLFFGLGFIQFPLQFFRPRGYIRLTSETIEVVGLFGKRQFELPFREIAEARMVKRGRTRFVALIPRNPDYGLKSATPGARRSARLSNAMFGSRFLVHPGNYSVKPKRLVEEVERRVAALNAEPGAYPRPISRG